MPVLRLRAGGAVVAACLLAYACSTPAGSVLVNIDTDALVPDMIDRVRIDVLDLNGHLIVPYRDAKIQAPSTDAHAAVATLPVSFALAYFDRSEVWVRVRGYREGHIRSGATTPNQPFPAANCGQPVELMIGERAVLSASRASATDAHTTSCTRPDCAPATVARFEVVDAGQYEIQLDVVSPGWPHGKRVSLLAAVVQRCNAEASFVACHEIGDATSLVVSRRLQCQLEPGSYDLLLANAQAHAFEVSVLVGTEQPATAPNDVLVEPEPTQTIDRIARVAIDPYADIAVDMLLPSDCLGVATDSKEAGTCAPAEFHIREHATRLTASRAGQWDRMAEKQDCTYELPQGLNAACVRGGAFWLGDDGSEAFGADASAPEQWAVIRPFFLDREEYSVQRYRKLLARGFDSQTAATPPEFDNPFDTKRGSGVEYCSFRAAPWNREKFERLPLSCVTWEAARKICAAEGGDLPTNAQWEFAAAMQGPERTEKRYPWGDDPPSCAQLVTERWMFDSGFGVRTCGDAGSDLSAEAVDAAGDIQPLTGLRGLGGNVQEWTLDSHRSYHEACWRKTGHVDPMCDERDPALRTVKGSSWRDARTLSVASARTGIPPKAMLDRVGFRCAYSGSRPPKELEP